MSTPICIAVKNSNTSERCDLPSIRNSRYCKRHGALARVNNYHSVCDKIWQWSKSDFVINNITYSTIIQDIDNINKQYEQMKDCYERRVQYTKQFVAESARDSGHAYEELRLLNAINDCFELFSNLTQLNANFQRQLNESCVPKLETLTNDTVMTQNAKLKYAKIFRNKKRQLKEAMLSKEKTYQEFAELLELYWLDNHFRAFWTGYWYIHRHQQTNNLDSNVQSVLIKTLKSAALQHSNEANENQTTRIFYAEIEIKWMQFFPYEFVKQTVQDMKSIISGKYDNLLKYTKIIETAFEKWIDVIVILADKLVHEDAQKLSTEILSEIQRITIQVDQTLCYRNYNAITRMSMYQLTQQSLPMNEFYEKLKKVPAHTVVKFGCIFSSLRWIRQLLIDLRVDNVIELMQQFDEVQTVNQDQLWEEMFELMKALGLEMNIFQMQFLTGAQSILAS